MPRRETLLEMAERHVREGEKRIAKQRALIEKLAKGGHTTDDALMFLQQLHAAQQEHIAHLMRLRNSAH